MDRCLIRSSTIRVPDAALPTERFSHQTKTEGLIVVVQGGKAVYYPRVGYSEEFRAETRALGNTLGTSGSFPTIHLLSPHAEAGSEYVISGYLLPGERDYPESLTCGQELAV